VCTGKRADCAVMPKYCYGSLRAGVHCEEAEESGRRVPQDQRVLYTLSIYCIYPILTRYTRQASCLESVHNASNPLSRYLPGPAARYTSESLLLNSIIWTSIGARKQLSSQPSLALGSAPRCVLGYFYSYYICSLLRHYSIDEKSIMAEEES
jgi:hypothetical protein